MNIKKIITLTFLISSALNAMEELPFALSAMQIQEPEITYLAEIVTLLESQNNNNNNNVTPEYKVLASLKIFKHRGKYLQKQQYYGADEDLSDIELTIVPPDFDTKTIKKIEIEAYITVGFDGCEVGFNRCETDRVFEESFENVVFDVPALKPFTDEDNNNLFMRFTAITKFENNK